MCNLCSVKYLELFIFNQHSIIFISTWRSLSILWFQSKIIFELSIILKEEMNSMGKLFTKRVWPMLGIFVSNQMHFVNAAKFIRLQFHSLFFLRMALDKLQYYCDTVSWFSFFCFIVFMSLTLKAAMEFNKAKSSVNLL